MAHTVIHKQQTEEPIPAPDDPSSSLTHVRTAIAHLRFAREHLRAAGARLSLDRVRLALKSAEGAERHQNRLRKERETP